MSFHYAERLQLDLSRLSNLQTNHLMYNLLATARVASSS
jgi:hypothetical protein